MNFYGLRRSWFGCWWRYSAGWGERCSEHKKLLVQRVQSDDSCSFFTLYLLVFLLFRAISRRKIKPEDWYRLTIYLKILGGSLDPNLNLTLGSRWVPLLYFPVMNLRVDSGIGRTRDEIWEIAWEEGKELWNMDPSSPRLLHHQEEDDHGGRQEDSLIFCYLLLVQLQPGSRIHYRTPLERLVFASSWFPFWQMPSYNDGY